jgi:hypothetical protein
MFARFADISMTRLKVTLTKKFRPEPHLKNYPTAGNALSAALQRMCFSRKADNSQPHHRFINHQYRVQKTPRNLRKYFLLIGRHQPSSFPRRLPRCLLSQISDKTVFYPKYSITFSSLLHASFHGELLVSIVP